MKRIEKVNLILKEQDNEVKQYENAMVQYSNVAKKVLSEINFKKIKKVKKTPEVENLYRFFYTTLYKENENTFDFAKFEKIALTSQITDF